MKKKFLFVSAGIVSLVCASAMVGCGKFKDRDDRLVIARSGDWALEDGQEQSRARPPELRRFIQFLDLFYDPRGFSREGAFRIFSQVDKNLLLRFFGGEAITPQELVNALFKFDVNGDGQLTLDEFIESIKNRLPTLQWVPSDRPVSRAELNQKIALRYSDSSEIAREGLVHALFRFDESVAAEGNRDELLSQQELGAVQWMLGFLDKINIESALLLPPNATALQKMILQILYQKVNQQIFTRYAVTDYKNLTPGDFRLELMQLLVRFAFVDTLVQKHGRAGSIQEKDQARVLSLYGVEHKEDWKGLRKFYDNPLVGGNSDGDLNSFEAFNILTDVEYADQMYRFGGSTTDPGQIGKNGYLKKHLSTLFPKTAWHLFFDGPQKDPVESRPMRTEYWDNLAKFDLPERGGNGDKSVDVGEITFAVNYARILEALYFLFDQSGDNLLSKKEFEDFINLFGKDKVIPPGKEHLAKWIIDLFFANKGLDKDRISLLEILMFILSNPDKMAIDNLPPHEFYIRMEQVLPEFLK